jgi:DNA-binding NarL/FixJ family response regulator
MKKIILPSLSNIQIEIINGSLLGDGSLSGVRNKNWNWKFTKGQSQFDTKKISKKSYMDWHFKMLQPYSSKISKGTSKSKIVMKNNLIVNTKTNFIQSYKFSFTTKCNETWTNLSKKWYLWKDGKPFLKNNKIVKIIPKDLVLTPLSVCVWFMDDGYLDSKNGNAKFCTHGFTWEECEFLSKRLKKDLGIESYVKKDSRGYPIIFLGVKSHKKLIEIIEPYVEWDCFKYKIDKSYNKVHQIGQFHSLSKLTENEIKKMIEMRRNGVYIKDIAKKFKISESCVSFNTTGYRWGHLKENFIKVKNKPRVTKEKIERILELNKEGVSQGKIAKLFKLNQSTVSRILKRKQ